MKRSAARIKEYFKRRYPAPYATLHSAMYPILREIRFISKVGVAGLVRHSLSRMPWQQHLPVQATAIVELPELPSRTASELKEVLDANGVEFSEGGHSLYIPPTRAARRTWPNVFDRYPENAGLKILKNSGSSETSGYLHGSGHSLLQRAVLYDPRKLVLASNLLHAHGISPRLYDFLEIKGGATSWSAYAVAHCNGREPTIAECEEAIRHLTDLERRRVITAAVPGGYHSHPDFACPGCNGNAFVDRTSNRFQYVDFQNFVLENYESYLTDLASRASLATHFGDTSIFRGGRYLYQTVPGVRLRGKRSTGARTEHLSHALTKAEVSLRDRVVLDVGCNLGMMMGIYLRLGAAWCHGWDRATVTRFTEPLLMAIGGTRFSVTGRDIAPDTDLEGDLPAHVRSRLRGCVISYLSVSGHLGWLKSLSRIDWSAMILEGHENETEDQFLANLQQLNSQVPCRVAFLGNFKDGDSGSRYLAIVTRSA